MSPRAELIERVVALTAAGKSRRQVAEILGVTRSAVCGIVDRAARRGALDLGRLSDDRLAGQRPAARRKRKAQREPTPIPPPPETIDLDRPGGREPRGCRWIYGHPNAGESWTYCQDPQTPGSPYCLPHKNRAFVRHESRSPGDDGPVFDKTDAGRE